MKSLGDSVMMCDYGCIDLHRSDVCVLVACGCSDFLLRSYTYN